MVLLSVLDVLLAIVGAAGLLYQGVCILVSLFSKPVRFPDAPMDKRFAVLISARNESNVIGNLIGSIHGQTYPTDLIDIWLVADNCTDDTADVARSLGCHVIERFNQEQIGKGYALTYLLDRMQSTGEAQRYDAFFVFDADNRLDPHYIAEMNKAFQSGFRILTSYRNSVNLSDNWVSSGSALWFIRESRFLNSSRMRLGTSCHVGGTGFMFSREIMNRNKGWKFHLLTEDLEFTMDSVLHGDRVGYCGTAILYDEQPVTFRQSWRQRLRWSKGFLQVFRYYGPALIKRAVRERDFSAVDLTLLICPFMVLGVIRPTVEMMDTVSHTKHIGILGTNGTISSGSYTLEIKKMFPAMTVTGEACPMWVPLVENNEFDSPGADYFVRKHIEHILSIDPLIDTLVLGCTHYPLLINKIRKFLPDGITLFAQGEYVAASLKDYLRRHPEMDARLTKQHTRRFLTTESAAKFSEAASLFLNQPITVEQITIN